MCLYPKTIENRKYKANKKNGGIIPPVNDNRTRWIKVGCENCIECRKQKARAWQVRLLEDIKTNTNGKFITLTFSNKAIKNIIEGKDIDGKQIREPLKTKGYDLDNEIATTATRDFLERWRKKYKKSVRHWMVTELGHKGTENIHLHGIIWTNEPTQEITNIWKYGYTWTGYKRLGKIINYVNEQTVNYINKYINKIDLQHKTYKSKVLTSSGIGNKYNGKYNKYNGTETNELYRTRTGHKINLPPYYRNKIYTQEEREKLWIQKLNKEEIWICGEKLKNHQTKQIEELLKFHRTRNAELKYGKHKDKNYFQRKYIEEKRRTILQEARITASPGSIQKG